MSTIDSGMAADHPECPVIKEALDTALGAEAMQAGEVRVTIALDPLGRAVVQRDMELIREILLAVEARNDQRPKVPELEGRDPLVVGHHAEMLLKAKLIEGKPSSRTPHSIAITDLTWEGRDFLDALRNKTVWGKLKEKFEPGELAAIPFVVIKDVALGLAMQWAKEKAGLA